MGSFCFCDLKQAKVFSGFFMLNSDYMDMEQPNTPERLVEDNEVILVLRKGLDNPETQELFNKWLDHLEAQRTEDTLYDIEVSVRRAKVYYQAGFVEEALADLYETLDGAQGEGEKGEKIREEIEILLGKMERGEDL